MFNIKKIFNHSKKNTKKRKRMSKAEKELDYITRMVALNAHGPSGKHLQYLS